MSQQPDPRAVLDDLADRYRRCRSAIETLAAFYGLDPAPWLGETNGAPRETTPKGGKRKAARPTEAPTEIQERILVALKTAGEPVSPGELAKALKIEGSLLRYHVRGLVARRQVKAEGVTASRRLSLP
jgi:hypothetical protein